MKIKKIAILLTFPLITFISLPSLSSKKHDSRGFAVIKAEAVNAFNERLGEPVSTVRFLGDFTFSSENGVCGETQAEPILASTSKKAELCTYFDPFLHAALHNLDSTSSPESLNIPYSEFPQVIAYDGSTAPLPQTDETPWYETSNGSQVDGYTVKDWFKAEAKMLFNCGKKTNTFTLSAKNMVPGGIYTLWSIIYDQESNALLPLPQPFGGTSANAFVANHKGELYGERLLNTCIPTIPSDDQHQLISIIVSFHADGMVHGALPSTVERFPHIGSGMNVSPQMMFTIPESFNFRSYK